MVTTVNTTEARERFADLVDRARHGRERIVIEKNGKPAVVLLAIEDLELLEKLEAMRDELEFAEAKSEADTAGYESYAEYRASRLARATAR